MKLIKEETKMNEDLLSKDTIIEQIPKKSTTKKEKVMKIDF